MPRETLTVEKSRPTLSFVSWTLGYAEPKLVTARLRTSNPQNASLGDSNGTTNPEFTVDEWTTKRDTSLDSLFERIPVADTQAHITNWPRKLALMDVEKTLPKLSTLPSTEDKNLPIPYVQQFASQAELDMVFQNDLALSYETRFEIGLTFWSDGIMSPSLFGVYHMGNSKVSSKGFVKNHCTHALTHMHSLLLMESDRQNTASDGEKAYLVHKFVNFNAIRGSRDYLNLSVFKTMKLEKLQAYILQCIISLRAAWNSGQDLPSKFLRNVGESLAESGSADIITGLYHLAVTGDCWPVVKEWLNSELAERGSLFTPLHCP
jgi:anaphase-promoting complex subunit 4